jgi:hypothetical protein
MRGGRPYGGIGFTWRKSSTCKIKLLGVDDLHRVMAVKALIGGKKFIIVGLYLPCYVNCDEYKGDLLACAEFIDSMFNLYLNDVHCTLLMIGDWHS